MITAYTEARIQAAHKLSEARNLIVDQRSLICWGTKDLEEFRLLTQTLDRLVNHVMRQEVISEQSLSE